VPVDTLAWTVQLAAYGAVEKALALADRLNAGAHAEALVTPVSLGGRTVWYRVLAGPYPTRDSAAAARATLWRRHIVPAGQGDLLRAPYSLALSPTADVGRLRRGGIPAVQGRGAGPALVGAFETPEQASLTQARLARAGVHATLITRVDTTP
jgi:cell division protein FtsN